MRLREVFRFELQQILRSAATWVYAVLLFLIAAWMLAATHDGDIYFNAPIRLTHLAVAAGMFGLLVTAGLFGSVAVRDVEAGMDPLLYTTSLTKAEYLGGRFLAALVVNAALLLLLIPGQLLATWLYQRFQPELVGPFSLTAYLQVYALFLLPPFLFAAGIMFTTAMLVRSVIPVYISAIVLFIAGVVAGNYAGRIDSAMLSALVDPFALAAIGRLSSVWTPVEQNTQLLGFPAPLVWSRLLLLGIAAAALLLLWRTFRFAHGDEGGLGGQRGGRAGQWRNVAERKIERYVSQVSVASPRVTGSFGGFTWVRQTLAVARRCLAEVTTSRAFIVLLALSFGLTLLWGWNVGSTVFETPVWPITHLVAAVALSERNVVVGMLFIALYAGEMVWKDRDVGMAEIADAAPVPEGAILFGRYLAVVATLAMMVLVFLAAGITLQALQGYYRFEPGHYLRILFGINLVDYALFAAVAMVIHVLVNQKYAGHILMLAFFVLTAVAEVFGIHHPLLVFGEDAGWAYSEMNGFGPFSAPLAWFRCYWAAWALLLLVAASVAWVRGHEGGMRRRLRAARVRFSGRLAQVAGVAVALILVFGGFIFYNTNVLNEYRTPEQRAAQQAEYEQRYRRFANSPQPTIVSAELRTEIHPEQRAVDLSGTFRLENRTGAPLDSVHVQLDPGMQVRSLSFDRPATRVLADDEHGFHVYVLAQALEPGGSLALSFELSRRPRGFPYRGIPTEVVENGSYFHRAWLPMIGYQPALELNGDRERRRLGLASRARPDPARDPAALKQRHLVRNEDLVRVNAIIGTSADQLALTPGVLQRSWTENGRRYFQYQTAFPESFGVATFSGRYAVRQDRWEPASGGEQHPVELRIYHHPAHTENADRALHGMKASLEYFTEQFGPFPWSQLSIVEVPPYEDFGTAHPGLISFAETFFHTRVGEDNVDEPFYGTAHEVAHHWWGGQVRGAAVPGAAFLSESLANYSAMLVTEKVYGPAMVRRVYDGHMDRYLRGRAERSREVPVLDVLGQSYLSYRRGAVALWILREHIGRERVNAALRQYLEKYRAAGPPFPTSRDLYAELRAVTPDSLHGLLSDLLETITLWDVRLEQAESRRLENGEYEVTLDVVARKVRADSVGRETEVPMNDLVDIAIFAGEEEQRHLERKRLSSGRQSIRMIVPREPARVSIDPSRLLIERDREDNQRRIRPAATASDGLRSSHSG